MRSSSLAAPVLAALALALLAPAAGAATITVTSGGDALADDGACTLREALLAAASQAPRGGCPAGGGDDVIALAVPVVTLALAGAKEDAGLTGDLDVHGFVTIRGDGATIDGAQLDRVLDVRPDGALDVEDLTITHGRTPAGGAGNGLDGADAEGGGGIRADGALKLRRVAVVDNRTGAGGDGGGDGAHGGTLSSHGGNAGRGGDGGGILATATITLAGVTIARNATGDGGTGGSAFAGTQATHGGHATGGESGSGGNGGGLALRAAATITDTTIADNLTGTAGLAGDGHGGAGASATSGAAGPGGIGIGGSPGRGGSGGGVHVFGSALVTITGSLIARNATGAGRAGGNGYGGGGGNGRIAGSGTASGGAGGTAAGFAGGSGGAGGGLAAVAGLGAEHNVRLTGVTIVANTTGPAGRGGDGFGAPGGAGGTGAAGGTGGGSTSGDGGYPGHGGGLWQSDGPVLRVRGSTIARNVASQTIGAPGTAVGGSGGFGTPDGGNGISNVGAPGVVGAGGLSVWFTGAELTGSIVADNVPSQCSRLAGVPSFGTGAGNVSWPAGAEDCPGSVIADPLLAAALGDHGGFTQTLRLGAGSPAIDLVAAGGGCDATDQRGVPRPAGAACDAGAYERAAPGLTATGADSPPSVTTLTGTVDARRGRTTVHAEIAGGVVTADVVVPAGTDASVPVKFIVGLVPKGTHTYTLVGSNDDGSARSAPVTFTASGVVGDPGPPGGGAGGGGGGQPPSLAKPRLTKLKLSPAALRRGKKTTISWTDSAAATVTLTVARKASGVRRGRSCVAPPRKATKKARRCTRWIAVKGSLTHRDAPGANRLSWNGRLRGKALAAGAYRLTATPRLGTVTGNAAIKAFTIRR